MACKVCDRIRQIMDIAEFAGNVESAVRNEPDEVAMNLLSATPVGRGIKTARTVGRVAAPVVRKAAKTPAAKRAARRLSSALTKVNAKARLKSGNLRKGWSQSRIMKEAHKIAKKGGIR